MTLQVDASFGVIACCGIILSPTATVLSMHKSARMSIFAASFVLELRRKQQCLLCVSHSLAHLYSASHKDNGLGIWQTNLSCEAAFSIGFSRTFALQKFKSDR
ncbi:MAG: hypothetical protein PUP91_24190 [Rhizonema sp. PD37]|nr:hypothetical protein [Rhizonema sp. PD37]